MGPIEAYRERIHTVEDEQEDWTRVAARGSRRARWTSSGWVAWRREKRSEGRGASTKGGRFAGNGWSAGGGRNDLFACRRRVAAQLESIGSTAHGSYGHLQPNLPPNVRGCARAVAFSLGSQSQTTSIIAYIIKLSNSDVGHPHSSYKKVEEVLILAN